MQEPQQEQALQPVPVQGPRPVPGPEPAKALVEWLAPARLKVPEQRSELEPAPPQGLGPPERIPGPYQKPEPASAVVRRARPPIPGARR